jgi:hypothetical protein
MALADSETFKYFDRGYIIEPPFLHKSYVWSGYKPNPTETAIILLLLTSYQPTTHLLFGNTIPDEFSFAVW